MRARLTGRKGSGESNLAVFGALLEQRCKSSFLIAVLCLDGLTGVALVEQFHGPAIFPLGVFAALR